VKPFEERYTLRLPLGENELGSVWTAHDTETDASVAVVMLEVEAGDAVRARFRDHAERLMGVRHPNVVRALDRGDTAEGTPYLVVELLEGESLAARLAQSAVRVDRAVEWLAGAADGLGALHAAGIAHGDIEPGNVFLAGEGGKDTAKIIGLALNRVDARTGSDAASRTSLASLQQGYAYAAPEQLRGEVQASPAADLYSLGAVAFAVLAGRPPFVAPDPGSLLEAVRTRRPPGLGTVKRELAGYATILERALSAEPSRRFADGAAFARALKTCLLMSRPTASLELPAGPRSPLGESDSLDAARSAACARRPTAAEARGRRGHGAGRCVRSVDARDAERGACGGFRFGNDRGCRCLRR
jgi:serine/threonine protein kinase